MLSIMVSFHAPFVCHSGQISNIDYKATVKDQNLSATW